MYGGIGRGRIGRKRGMGREGKMWRREREEWEECEKGGQGEMVHTEMWP
jgi:hypothetical protein